MPKVKISNNFIKKVKTPTTKSKVDYFDIQTVGLMLEVKKGVRHQNETFLNFFLFINFF